MRLFLSNLIFLMFFCFPLCGEENSINYVVKVSGIKIGELNWEIKLETNKYTNKLRLKSKGLLFFEINNKYYDDLNQYLVENDFKFQKFDDHRGLSRFIFALKSNI